MILLTLTGYYTNQTNNVDGPAYAKRYLEDLRDDTDLYIKYTNWVYNEIHTMHITTNQYYMGSWDCDGVREIKEGWNVHTWDKMFCRFSFSPMLVSTETCGMDGEVR